MTIVAYRNGVLASDSQIQQGNTRSGTGRKIVKTKDGFLAGGAGDYASITEFLKWAEGDKEDSPGNLENFEGILVYPKIKKIVTYDSEGTAMDIKAEFYVLGAGGDIALGAMEMGATPQEAVETAIKWCTACGGKIQAVKL